jgi:DNA-binding beta-propeller fold protein YncE
MTDGGRNAQSTYYKCHLRHHDARPGSSRCDRRRIAWRRLRIWPTSKRPTTPRRRVAQQFGNPVRCARIADDGLVYVRDRINDRIQVFKKDGTFVTEWFYERNTLGNGAVWDIAIWPDPKQTWLLTADGENNEIRIVKRDDGSVVGSFGHNGRNAGQFHWVHAMAVDKVGNVYNAEVDTGKTHPKVQAHFGRTALTIA